MAVVSWNEFVAFPSVQAQRPRADERTFSPIVTYSSGMKSRLLSVSYDVTVASLAMQIREQLGLPSHRKLELVTRPGAPPSDALGRPRMCSACRSAFRTRHESIMQR